MQINNSPVDKFCLNHREFLVKRDDLLDDKFNGNKARKLAYYLANDFPNITQIISYGGTQSNMLLALSYLAKVKNWQFTYYCYQPSKQALLSTESNLAQALASGTQLKYVNENLDSFIHKQIFDKNTLLIHQGGRQIESIHGISQLANEINEYAKSNQINQLAIFIPSGTGTSAYYLQQKLPQHIVYTTNCVGKIDYLRMQWQSLSNKLNQNSEPIILINNKYRFATPDLELFQTIKHIEKVSNINFDLVYDPVGWQILLDNLDSIDLPIMYVHCGGLMGNLTMVQRYHYLFPEYFAKI